MRTDAERLQHWWDAKAPAEEIDRADEAVNRALRWREIDRRLRGVATILEIGGGTGAFSIPLARRGYRVVHLDISPAMLESAKQKAGDLPNIEFVAGDASDLSCFEDQQFDMVFNMDGAISFSGRQADRCVMEACRVAKKTVILTTSQRANLVACCVDESLAATGDILPAVHSLLDRGWWDQDEFQSNGLLMRGCVDGWLPPLRAYTRQELAGLVSAAGFAVLRAGGLGSLSNILPRERLTGLLDNPEAWQKFIEVCDRFDQELMPDGPGTWQRAGLIAVGVRE